MVPYGCFFPRVQERVPFQYLIASAHWHTYVLSVSPGVLIPRPETEIFVELVQDALRRRPHLAAMPWADLGTGSGAIAIATADVLRKRNEVRPVATFATCIFRWRPNALHAACCMHAAAAASFRGAAGPSLGSRATARVMYRMQPPQHSTWRQPRPVAQVGHAPTLATNLGCRAPPAVL